MDLQSGLAFQSKLIKSDSLKSKILDFVSTFSPKHSNKIIAQDSDIKRSIEKKTKHKNIKVISPWSLVPMYPIIDRNENEFRKKHNLIDKIVIIFSGRKVIYTGPEKSFIVKLLKTCNANISIRDGDHEKLVPYLLNDASNISSVLEQGTKNREYVKTNFNPTELKEKMYSYILSDK